jgi:hypothetical protein
MGRRLSRQATARRYNRNSDEPSWRYLNSGNNFCHTLLDDSGPSSIQNITPGGNPGLALSKANPLAAFNGKSEWHLTLNGGDNALLKCCPCHANYHTGNLRATQRAQAHRALTLKCAVMQWWRHRWSDHYR